VFNIRHWYPIRWYSIATYLPACINHRATERHVLTILVSHLKGSRRWIRIALPFLRSG
jgi:hypothetical protein